MWLKISLRLTDTMPSQAIKRVQKCQWTHHAAKGLEWPVVVLMDLGVRCEGLDLGCRAGGIPWRI